MTLNWAQGKVGRLVGGGRYWQGVERTETFVALRWNNIQTDAKDRVEGRVSERSSVTRYGDLLDFGQLLKPLAAINLPKSPTFLGIFLEGVKINHFSSEIIFGQLL